MTNMRFVPHPADQELLERLVDDLIDIRTARGVSQRVLAAAAGTTHGSLYSLERRRPANPLVGTLQRYAGPLEHDLRIDLEGLGDLPAPPAAVALAAGGYLGSATVAHLRGIREHRRIPRTQLQARHGWHWSSLAAFENCDREPLLAMVQRYARCLGGRAVPSWVAAC